LPKILNVTDIHIVPEGSSVMGLDPRERLRMVFRSIDRHHADADLCVITGDLTDKGDAASYVDPVGANPVFAREYPTADRRGRIEPADPSVDVRWI
jgi:3',5'-cyclic AMP phosphodiesterase CpdA